MREQYVWPAGTPVLMLGLGCDFPTENGVMREWVTAAAGRLEEAFCPGGPILMREGPMATSLPSRGWKTYTLYRSGSRGWAEGMSDSEYGDCIHDAWKHSFLIIADKDAQDHLGARCFILLRSEADFPDRSGRDTEPLVERLERLERPGLYDLLPLVSEISWNVEWHLGGYYGWGHAELDERGEPMRLCCTKHLERRRLRL